MTKEDVNNETVVVGSGLAGLSAAYHLKKNYSLFEKDNEIGGMTRSVRKDGYMTITRWREGRWDINNDRTPWFTKDDRIRQNVQADEWMPLPGSDYA